VRNLGPTGTKVFPDSYTLRYTTFSSCGTLLPAGTFAYSGRVSIFIRSMAYALLRTGNLLVEDAGTGDLSAYRYNAHVAA
jgi:hypothetical protein